MTDLTSVATPLPDIADRDIAGYWEGTAAHELRVPRSKITGDYIWPPRPGAVGVADFDLEWVAVPASGELFTWTVVRQTGLAGFAGITPYAVAVVQLDEVPVRMLGYLDADIDSLVGGLRLVAEFVDKGDGVILPIWKPAN